MFKILITLPLCAAMTFCQTVQSIQANPAVQAAETAAISIGGTLATGSPAFAALAPIAVNGLSALAANIGKPTAVTGVVANDAPLIVSTVAAMIPTSTGKTAAVAIANAYTTAMTSPGVPQTTTGANAVLAAIASGLSQGASPVASGPAGQQGKSASFGSKHASLDRSELRVIWLGPFEATLPPVPRLFFRASPDRVTLRPLYTV